MNPQTSRKIRNRTNPNDVFITPKLLAKRQIDMVMSSLQNDKHDNAIWYDPFRNSGNYFYQFPEGNHHWSEILDGDDFFAFPAGKHVDVVYSNPPYSCINQILAKTVEIKPKYISYLVGVGNLTPKRLEFLNIHGYFMENIHMCNVTHFYGSSFIIQFKLGLGNNVMSYDRGYWKNEARDILPRDIID